ncbi:hypothetical protein JTB14_025136 [Gonioctena quinquepunctata]|nr:hypothetical protein JTB14_025136 [Gonioctena quinquepunctata]
MNFQKTPKQCLNKIEKSMKQLWNNDNVDSLVNHLQPTQICLTGDFNHPHATSSQVTFSSSASPTERAPANESISIEIISNTICLHNLFQINDILNSANSLLDLVMIQKNNISISPANDVLIQDPYHPPLSFELPVKYALVATITTLSQLILFIRELLDQVSWNLLFKNKLLDHMINIYEILNSH